MMSEFIKVKSIEAVIKILWNRQPLSSETVPIGEAHGRVCAVDIRANENVPPFDRAVMDGYAVRARDTFGASESLPAMLEVVGEVFMGKPVGITVGPGQAAVVPTGGMIPVGTDAVVMVEHTLPVNERTVEVTRPVTPGEHILKTGEDIGSGKLLLKKGDRLRSQDTGVLAALGVCEVAVYRRPNVAILSTGDEIVPEHTLVPPAGCVRDINGVTLHALVSQTGSIPGMRRIVRDDPSALAEACRDAFTGHDMVLLSGGSSVGGRDYTLEVLNALPEVELLVHGVAVRPGKPTILATVGEKVFWGLPGNPVSALMIAETFVLPSLAVLEGESPECFASRGKGGVTAVSDRRIASVHGRTDLVPVVFLDRSIPLGKITPVFGKSAAIGVLAEAHGYIIIPEHSEGLDQGEEVRVFLF